jgi:hypothetical protein
LTPYARNRKQSGRLRRGRSGLARLSARGREALSADLARARGRLAQVGKRRRYYYYYYYCYCYCYCYCYYYYYSE